MKSSLLRELIREQIRKIIYEKTQDEIAADKKSVDAEIKAAQARIKAATANVKVAKDKLVALNKKKAEVGKQVASSETESETETT